MLYLVGLGFLAGAYLGGWIDPRSEIGALPTPVLWFGALGAVLLSLTGVFDHPYDWDNGYLLWHIARPFVGAAVAIVAVLMFIAGILAAGSNPDPASGPNRTSDIFYYLVAFLVGYREETFRSLIKRLADVVLMPATTTTTTTTANATGTAGATTTSTTSTAGGPTGPPKLTAVVPTGGVAGDEVVIQGSGLAAARAVTFGAVPATAIKILSDGSLTAIVPEGASGEVVVAVTTSQGAASGPTFTYDV
jgi:hypothetical protein